MRDRPNCASSSSLLDFVRLGCASGEGAARGDRVCNHSHARAGVGRVRCRYPLMNQPVASVSAIAYSVQHIICEWATEQLAPTGAHSTLHVAHRSTRCHWAASPYTALRGALLEPAASDLYTFTRLTRRTASRSLPGCPGITLSIGWGPTSQLPVRPAVALPGADWYLLAFGMTRDSIERLLRVVSVCAAPVCGRVCRPVAASLPSPARHRQVRSCSMCRWTRVAGWRATP